VSNSQDFSTKRASAKDNYVVLIPGLERTQKLPGGAELRLKIDGQVSDQPLISNEQYSAGGMDTVRGYYESEISGDNALHFSAEVAAPDLAALAGLGGKGQLIPYLFYDYASVRVKQPLPGQAYGYDISATGIGVRGGLLGSFEYQLDGAFALRDSGTSATNTYKGDGRALFKVKALF
jgi:hemolysin activation/secretion protein